ncbi:hypothetical protein SEA_ALBEDO_39 [Microbacterium phage Albedo]|nr:hypothetical protein SEA_ALBEDO_39 [Microbacterium phage Albedo]
MRHNEPIMVKYLRHDDKVVHRGIVKTIQSVVILTNTVNVTFTDGTTGFWSRGHLITLIQTTPQGARP